MPRLSVIVLSFDGTSVTKLIRHLCTHRLASQIEIVVAIDESSTLGLEAPAGLGGFRVIKAPVIDDLGKARADAIRAASAPYVVFGEDHSFPVDGWAEGLLKSLESGAAGVGPQILVGNPATSVSWSDAILCYGKYLQPSQQSGATSLPWHNSAYRRDALLSLGDSLEFLLKADVWLQAELVRHGHRFALTPHAATNHYNSSLLWPQLKALYCGNRMYGATRASHQRWSFPRRLFYTAAWPAIVALRARRAVRICFALRDRRIRYLTLLPLLFVGSVVAATGEVWGYLFGLGHNTMRQRSYYELNRALHVLPAEAAMFRD